MRKLGSLCGPCIMAVNTALCFLFYFAALVVSCGYDYRFSYCSMKTILSVILLLHKASGPVRKCGSVFGLS